MLFVHTLRDLRRVQTNVGVDVDLRRREMWMRDEPTRNNQIHIDESNYNLRSNDVYASSILRGRGRGSSFRQNLMDEDDDVVVLENSDTEEEDVKEDESDHNKEQCTFEDDDDDGEFDDLD
ncbi:hypothetical protein Tco_0791580 [Tanacetum coccineum]